MPIIILSAKAAEMDKVAGLELGAEDYVAKPSVWPSFWPAFAARFDGTRPASAGEEGAHLVGDVEVDVAAARSGGRKAGRRHGDGVRRPHGRRRRRGGALSRGYLRRVWGQNHHGRPGPSTTSSAASCKLETDPQEPCHPRYAAWATLRPRSALRRKTPWITTFSDSTSPRLRPPTANGPLRVSSMATGPGSCRATELLLKPSPCSRPSTALDALAAQGERLRHSVLRECWCSAATGRAVRRLRRGSGGYVAWLRGRPREDRMRPSLFGRVFRQNTIVATATGVGADHHDPTCDEIGRAFGELAYSRLSQLASLAQRARSFGA